MVFFCIAQEYSDMTTPPTAAQTMATLNDNPMGQVSGTLPAKLGTEPHNKLLQTAV